MQFRFSFKRMESSDALEQLAKQKIEGKITRFVTKPIEAHVVFEVEGPQHRVHCTVAGGDGFNIDVEATSDDMYTSVDLMADKLVTQMKRQKEKLKSHKGNSNVRNISEQVGRGKAKANDGEYIDAEDILKYEEAMRKRRSMGAV